MSESKRITVVRHLVLLLFVAIAIYPALNVLSISLRPGNQLRSTDLAIIPEDWTLNSYIQLFTEQPFLRWLGNSLVVATGVTMTGVVLAAIGGYAFSRFRFVGRNATMLAILTTQMFPATMLLLPLYILIAKLHYEHVLGPDGVLHVDGAAILRVADEGILRHDSRFARRSGSHRWLHAARRHSGE